MIRDNNLTIHGGFVALHLQIIGGFYCMRYFGATPGIALLWCNGQHTTLQNGNVPIV